MIKVIRTSSERELEERLEGLEKNYTIVHLSLATNIHETEVWSDATYTKTVHYTCVVQYINKTQNGESTIT